MRRLFRALDRHFGIIAIAPAAVAILLMFGYPVVSNVVLSFTNRSLVRTTTAYVGLSNYVRILTDPTTWNALANGVVYSFFSVGGQVVVGFVSALLVFKIGRPVGKSLARNVLLIPWATPFISSVFIWRWIYHDLVGLLNHLLSVAELIEQPIPWLGRPGLAMFSVVLRTVWFGVPLMMTSVLAGMQSIPAGQLDTAKLEGANTFQTVRYVIFPNVRGIVGVLAILRTIWTFNNFGNIYAMTGGGPLRSTQTLPLLAYETAWGEYLLGKSGALSVFITFFLAILLLVYFYALRLRDKVGV